MRVVFVNRFFYPDISATSQMLGGVAFGLANKKHEVVVFTSRLSYDDPTERLAARDNVAGVAIRRVWSSRFGRKHILGRLMDYLTFYVSLSLNLLFFLKARDIVIVKTDPPLVSVPVALVARLRGAVVVNWLQDLFPEVLTAAGMTLGPAAVNNTLLQVLYALRNLSLRLATRTVVIGELMRDRVIRTGVPADKLVVINNWADSTAIKPLEPSHNALRSAWGYTPDHVVVGYSGNMGVAHSLLSLIEAADKLKEHPRLRFLLIGGGQQCQRLMAEVQQRGLTGTVMFKPYQPQDSLEQSLNVADIHIVSLKPSMEGLIVPSKFYAIAAAGRPVVFLGDTQGELGLILQRHECGVAVKEGNAEELASALTTLAENTVQRRQMGSNARALIDDEYNLDTMLMRWSALLDDLQ